MAAAEMKVQIDCLNESQNAGVESQLLETL